MVFDLRKILGENLTQNILIAILIIIIFTIIFEILSRIKLFKKTIVAIISLIITLIALQTGFTRAIALKILQVSVAGFIITFVLLILVAFILFIFPHLSKKLKK